MFRRCALALASASCLLVPLAAGAPAVAAAVKHRVVPLNTTVQLPCSPTRRSGVDPTYEPGVRYHDNGDTYYEDSVLTTVTGANTGQISTTTYEDTGSEINATECGRKSVVLNAPGEWEVTTTTTHGVFVYTCEGEQAADLPPGVCHYPYSLEWGTWVDRGTSTDDVTRYTVLDACKGSESEVKSVRTPSGDDHGLSGTRLSRGQTINASEDTELGLGDGSRLRLRKGTTWRIGTCPSRTSREWSTMLILGTIWAHISPAFGDPEPEVRTERSVTGWRGTTAQVSYDRARKLTTVRVTKGSVTLRNLRGKRRRTLTVRSGRTGTQRGNAPPVLRRR